MEYQWKIAQNHGLAEEQIMFFLSKSNTESDKCVVDDSEHSVSC